MRSVDAFEHTHCRRRVGGEARSRAARDGVMLAVDTHEAVGNGADAGVAPWMAAASAGVQAWIAALAAAGAFAGAPTDAGWRVLADRIAREKTR